MKTHVAIVEDEKNYSNALKKIIDFDEELLCVGQIFNGDDALKELKHLEPDVVLIDIKLPFVRGTEVVAQLKPSMENTHFVMCTSLEDDDSIFKSLKAGASGYIAKGESMEKIIQAIKEVMNGGAPMSFGIARRVLDHFHDHQETKILENLTRSEKEVLEMLSDGLQYRDISGKKNISLDTVKKHVGNIYRKLHVSNRYQAMRIFQKVQPPKD